MPVKRRGRQAWASIITLLLILTLDQYSKHIVRMRLGVGTSIPIIRNILYITHVNNAGAAFGIFKNGAIIFVIISIVAIVLISLNLFKSIQRHTFFNNTGFDFGLLFILSGAIGNLIDRLRFGYVIDFIDVRIWPVFNIADTFISTGTFLLILSFFRHSEFR